MYFRTFTNSRQMYRFYKYQGTGNDFIILDNRSYSFPLDNQRLVERLCDRHFGIGADGLMLLQEAEDYDFEMVYFNADGRPGTMCGNGGRCMVAFAHRMGLFEEQTRFLAVDGGHTAFLSPRDGVVKLKMIDVTAVERHGEAFIMDTGSPHFVTLISHLSEYPVFTKGREIRYGEVYGEDGINVNFLEPHPEGGYAIRTYERGVEDETLACGTGATAAAMAMAVRENLEGDVQTYMHTLGGRLTVYFHKNGNSFTEVYLEGPAKPVFEGLIDFDSLSTQ